MKKLAFGYAGAGSFEMPRLQPVNLEKDSHIAFAKVPTSIYKGTGSKFTKQDMLKAATDNEIKLMNETVSGSGTVGA